MVYNRPALEAIHKSCLDLGQKKSNDYAAVADGIGICGIEGIATRLVDKVLRIKSLTTPGINQEIKDESIRDTLMDVINYATYGISLMDGTWNKSYIKLGPTSSQISKLAYTLVGDTISIRKPKWKKRITLKFKKK